MAEIRSTRALQLYATSPRITPPPLPASTVVSGASPGGDTIGAISQTAADGLTTAQLAQTTANTALSNATYALNELFSKLEAGTSYVLSGIATLTSAGGGIYTSGFINGNGLALTDNGLVMRQGGVTKVSILATGSPVFSGVVDCGNGAIIRTRNLVTTGSVDLVSYQNSLGQEFGKVVQYGSVLDNGTYYPGAGMEWNFSGNGAALIGVSDTATGYRSRLVMSANGQLWHGTYLGGVQQSGGGLARCDNTLQVGLNAHRVGGLAASDIALSSHSHMFENLPDSSLYRRCATAHWNGTSYDYDEFWIKPRLSISYIS